MAETRYVVLKEVETGWEHQSEVSARSARAAAKAVAAVGGSGRYVAVPKRSWAVVDATLVAREPEVVLG